MTDISTLRHRREAILAHAKSRGAARLNDQEDDEFRRLTDDIQEAERRQDAHSYADRIFNSSQLNSETTMYSDTSSAVYSERSAHQGQSFWRDLVRFKTNDDADGSARRRLAEHAEMEKRTGLTTTGDSSSFVPPKYLLEQWIPTAVAGKPFVATLPTQQTPQAHTINIPKIVTPPQVGVQNPELTTVTNVDLTDTYASTTLTTVAGQQLVSRQVLDQSPIDIDGPIFQSLGQVGRKSRTIWRSTAQARTESFTASTTSPVSTLCRSPAIPSATFTRRSRPPST